MPSSAHHSDHPDREPLPPGPLPTGTPIVRVDGLQKVYGRSWFRRRSVAALRGVTLEAHAGEVFGLLGPNGAGKTTLIKTLLGIIQPTAGKAELFGISVRSHAARRRVGYLPEALRIDRHHSATTALRLYGRLSGMNARSIGDRSEELLKLVGLENRAKESVRRFSKGMYQRLGLAQALMHDPDLLILDEPTDGLDPVGRTEVRRVIERLRDSGKTIFLNSHILQEVEMVCTRVAIMAGGTLRGLGTIPELRGGDPEDVLAVRARIKLPRSLDDGPSTDKPMTGSASLNGAGAALRSEMSEAGFVVDTLDQLPEENTHQLKVQIHSTSSTDALVDWLRARSISILELNAQRPSLEDTFMRLVGDEDKAELPRETTG
ncbi:MAG: ABC transporter ATP-binding protein [Planctomycetota bacterium]